MFASRITSLRARLSARLARTLVLAGVAAATTVMSACSSDGVTAPSAPVEGMSSSANRLSTITGTITGTVTGTVTGVVQTLTLVSGLTWSVPTTEASVSKVIGPSGGSFAIAGGIKVTVPKGAVSSSTTFKVTRIAGNIIAYDFQPHGIRFAVPLVIEHPTKLFNLQQLLSARSVRAAYFPDPSALDQRAGTAVVSEFRPTSLSPDRSTLKFTVDHFSGYMVSMD